MKIQELLDNLLHKKLGRDVRQSIHDSIEQCYKDATGHPESVAAVVKLIEDTPYCKYTEGELPDIPVCSIYPVGSIYMSIVDTNPGDLFGGKWEQIKDVFLLSAGNTYSAGSTGGESRHILTANEMPSHNHGSSSLNASVSSIVGQRDTGCSGGFNFSSYGSYGEMNTSSGQYAKTTGNLSLSASHEHAYDGNGESHNNMPPYLTVYMWKRIS